MAAAGRKRRQRNYASGRAAAQVVCPPVERAHDRATSHARRWRVIAWERGAVSSPAQIESNDRGPELRLGGTRTALACLASFTRAPMQRQALGAWVPPRERLNLKMSAGPRILPHGPADTNSLQYRPYRRWTCPVANLQLRQVSIVVQMLNLSTGGAAADVQSPKALEFLLHFSQLRDWQMRCTPQPSALLAESLTSATKV